MTVTVFVPRTLKPVFDGRTSVELGLPATAGVGELLDTLLRLYPKLRQHLASDRKVTPQQFSLFLGERALEDLAARRPNLREGQVVYLVGTSVKRAEPFSRV